ncbi:glycosyltransferase family 9 protein [Thermodesulfovibrio hydrogeniphilus]
MRVLALPLYGIGDVLMTTPAIRILKEQKPDISLTYICMFSSQYEILSKNPFIDRLILFPFFELGVLKSMRFALSLRGEFNCSINFYPSNRKHYNILAFLAGAPVRIGHRYLHRDFLELNFLKNKTIMENEELHNVEENVRLLSFFGINANEIPAMEIYLTDEEIERGRSLLKKGVLNIGIHAGTSRYKNHIHKRWDKEKFVELVNRMDGCHFFIFGGKDDEDVNRFIIEKCKNKVTLFENKPIREVASLIKALNLFISNDSGLMHIAAAVGTPVLAIFGPTNPNFVRPWGVKHKVVRAELPCSPCFYYSPKPLKCKINDKFKCLKEISVDEVLKSVESLLK